VFAVSLTPLRLAIIAGSTRPGRQSLAVSQWTLEQVKSLGSEYVHPAGLNRVPFAAELVDLATFNLPLLDEPVPAAYQKYSKDHTKAWAQKLSGFDSFLLVTPEYNHSAPPALTNGLSFVARELNNKSAAFVSYGSAGGVRAVEHLRGILSELQVAHVRDSVQLSLFEDFEKFSTFKPRPMHRGSLTGLLKQLHLWSAAMKAVRDVQK